MKTNCLLIYWWNAALKPESLVFLQLALLSQRLSSNFSMKFLRLIFL